MAGILTVAQQRQAWLDLVAAIAPAGASQPPMVYSVTDLVAAVQAADGWATANSASFNAALPAPFSGATAGQKAALLAFVIMRRFTG